MANPTLLQDDFSGGTKLDVPPHEIPANAARMIKNLLPGRLIAEAPTDSIQSDFDNYDAKQVVGGLAARGDPVNESLPAAGSTIQACAWFNAASVQVAVNNSGTVYTSTEASTTATSRGIMGGITSMVQNPVEFNDKMCFLDADGTQLVTLSSSFAEVAVTDGLTGGPGRYGIAFKQRLWTCAGTTAATATRLWWSTELDETDWDNTDGYVDLTYVPTGMAVAGSSLLIFSNEHIERVRGSPPDLIVEPIFNVGTPFPRSIITTNEITYFANPEGVWATDGASKPVNLIQQAGILTAWKQTFRDNTVPQVNLGLYDEEWLFVSAGSVTYADINGVLRIPSRSWFYLSPFDFDCMTQQYGNRNDVLAGRGDARELVSLAGIFNGPTGSEIDTDHPALVTRFYTNDNFSSHGIKSVYLAYVLDGASTQYVEIFYSHYPRGDIAYTPLPATGGTTHAAADAQMHAPVTRRFRTVLHKDDGAGGGAFDYVSPSGVQLSIHANDDGNGFGDFIVAGIGADIRSREGSRIGA